MLKQKTFNYLTLILAIITIFMVISVSQNNTSKWPCVIMLVITIIFSLISRKYNNEILYMNKKDKESLTEIEKIMKDVKRKKVNNINMNEEK